MHIKPWWNERFVGYVASIDVHFVVDLASDLDDAVASAEMSERDRRAKVQEHYDMCKENAGLRAEVERFRELTYRIATIADDAPREVLAKMANDALALPAVEQKAENPLEKRLTKYVREEIGSTSDTQLDAGSVDLIVRDIMQIVMQADTTDYTNPVIQGILQMSDSDARLIEELVDIDRTNSTQASIEGCKQVAWQFIDKHDLDELERCTPGAPVHLALAALLQAQRDAGKP